MTEERATAKTIKRAEEKAARREHVRRLREIATNKNFDAEKFAKYFDDQGKIIPELLGEYLRKAHGVELNRKSAEAQRA